jgi:hypothetical protein
MIFKITPSNLGYQLFLKEKMWCHWYNCTCILFCRWLVAVLWTQNMFHIRPKKNICVFPIAWSSKLGSGFFYFFLFLFFGTYKYALSFKITHTCLFLSYYSLLIIWHAVQCSWFQASIKCARKWRILLKSETNTETETNFRILPIYIFFGIHNVKVIDKILGSVGRSETHIFCWPNQCERGLC